MTIRMVIVDDEAPARAKLRRLLAAEPGVEVVAEASSGSEALRAIRDHDPHVVFLDVQMPGMSGLEVAAAFESAQMPHVVFVTAHSEHAVKAFEIRAIDYLLKPVTPRRFAGMMQRLREEISRGRPGSDMVARVQELANALRDGSSYLRRILVHGENKAFFLATDRIDWIEADRNYVRIHVGATVFSERATLSTIADRLDPSRFLRINRSQVIRLDAVKELHAWSHGDYQVVLQNGTTLMWSRRFRPSGVGAFRL